MRTTQAARYARWSVTIAAILAAGVLGVYLAQAWQARRTQVAAPPSVSAAVQQQSAEFTFSKVEGEQTRFVLRASRATEFKQGGRNLLEEVWITAYGNRGQRTDQLRAHSCEYWPAESKVTCPGQVEIDLGGSAAPGRAQEGDSIGSAHIVTSNLSFDRQTGSASSPDAVVFRFAQGEGKATGLLYNAVTGQMHLSRDVRITLRPVDPATPAAGAAAEEAMYLSSDELEYVKNERRMILKGRAELRRGSRRLRAGQMDFELDEAMRARRLVARREPEIEETAGGEQVAIAGNELAIPLDDAARPERLDATGNVIIRGMRADGLSELRASSAEVELFPESGQPRRLVAAGNVLLESGSSGGSLRRLQTPKLDVRFVQSQPAGYQIERLTASPGTAEWEAPGGGGAEHLRLSARELEGAFGAGGQLRELRGAGGVELRKGAAKQPETVSTSRDLLARFGADGSWQTVDQSGDVRLKNETGTAQSERAHFDREADTATLSGSVVLNQASAQTRASWAMFLQGAGELRAEGKVSTTEISSPGAGQSSAEPAHIISDRLAANTMTGRADYSGNARLWQGISAVQADSIHLDREQRGLVASGGVQAVFRASGPASRPRRLAGAGGEEAEVWHAEGAKLTYEDARRHIVLEKDASAVSKNGTISADRLDIVLAAAEGVENGVGARSLPDLDRAQVETIDASGAVRIESGGRIGTAERGVYSAGEGKFILSGGSPKVMDGFGNSAAGRELTFFLADDRIFVDSEKGSRTVTLHRVGK